MTRDFVLHDPDDIGSDVWAILGQSNAKGFLPGTIDVTYLDQPDPRVRQWPSVSSTYASLGRAIAAVDPLFHPTQTANTVGHGSEFGRRYARLVPNNRHVLLVPSAVESTGFTTSSLASPPTGYTTIAGGGWDPSGAQGGINLYETAIAQVNAAMASNSKNRLMGFLWLQGEADNASMTQAQYSTKLLELIDGLRSRCTGATSSTVFLIGQMVPERIAITTGYAHINAAHIDAARLRTRVAFYYGPTGQNDGANPPLHYSNEGQRRLGANAYAALALARANVLNTLPVAPTGATLVQTGTTVAPAWTRTPGRVTDYNIRYRVNAGSWTDLTRATNLDVTASIPGLTPGDALEVQVRTVNEQGISAWTASASLTLLTLPGQPTSLAAGTPTASAVPLTWGVPASGGTVASYLVEYKLRSSSTWLTFSNPAALNALVNGLTDTSLYDFRVTAQNAAGLGTPSATVSATTAAPAPFLGDVGVSAYRAVGLRRLNSSYSGPLVRVRRSSDNTEQDIGFLAGSINLDTASLLAFAGAGSAYVKTWYDQSGNARDLTQATTTAQARIVNAGTLDTQNGKPAALFDGVDDNYSGAAAGMYAAAGATMAAVAYVDSTGLSVFPTLAAEDNSAGSAFYRMLLVNSNGLTTFLRAQDDASGSLYSSAGTGQAGTLANTLRTWMAVDSATSIIAQVDGTTVQTVSYTRSGHTLTLNRTTLGASAPSGSNAYWKGYICELVEMPTALDSAHQATARANQKFYYGTV